MGSAGKLVSALFDVIDVDASGFLDEGEGKYFFETLGCDPEELDYYWSDLLRCADDNRDGMISKDEFVRYTMSDIEVADDGSCEDPSFEHDLRRKIMLLGPAGKLVVPSQQQLMQLVPLFEETKQFLRKVETVDKSEPRLSDWGAEASTPPPLPAGRRGPPARAAPSPPPPPPASTVPAAGSVGTDSHRELMQLVPLFDETKQFLRKVETADKSAPLLSASAESDVAEFMPAPAQQQLMQLVPLFEETKQFLRKVETVDKSQPYGVATVATGGGGGKQREVQAVGSPGPDLTAWGLQSSTPTQPISGHSASGREKVELRPVRIEVGTDEEALQTQSQLLPVFSDPNSFLAAPRRQQQQQQQEEEDQEDAIARRAPVLAQWGARGPPAPVATARQEGGGSRDQLLQLVPLFEETKQFLRKVETADKSAPRLRDWGAEATTPSILGTMSGSSSSSSSSSSSRPALPSRFSPPHSQQQQQQQQQLGLPPSHKSPELPARRTTLSPRSWQSASPRSRSPSPRTGPPLVDLLFPALGNALAALEAERPDNPLDWLGRYLLGWSSPQPRRSDRPSALQMMNVFDFFDNELAPALSEAMAVTQRSGATGSAAVQELGHYLIDISR